MNVAMPNMANAAGISSTAVSTSTDNRLGPHAPVRVVMFDRWMS